MHDTDINTSSTTINSVDSLLRYNETFYQIFMRKPFCLMISSGILSQDENKRNLFFSLVQIFSDHFQAMIQMRQASCRDEKFYPTFLKHFLDELGHDDLLRQREKITVSWDPIIVAISTWFLHQMQVLDNVEKAVVMHLVVEKSGDYYHSIGNKAFSQHTTSHYYGVHAKLDEDHTAMILDLLPGYPDFIYQRLSQLLKESWMMMYTMVDRMHEIVMRA